MIKKILFLLLLTVILISSGLARKLAVLPELMKPGVIEIDKDNIYVLDGVVVYVYSSQDFRLITKFGKRGQGPGELVPNDEIPLNMQLVNGNIFLNSQTKVIYYSKDGSLIKEKTLPFTCMQIVPLGNGFAAAKVGFPSAGQLTLNVILFDSQLKPLKNLVTFKRDEGANKRKIVIPPPYIYLHCANDTLFVSGGNQRDFHIEVFDRAGNPLKPVTMPYQRLQLSGSFKSDLLNWFKRDSRFNTVPDEVFQRLHFLETLPAIRNAVVTHGPESSRVYVQTYKQQDSDSEFFVLDFKGKLLQKVFLPTASRYKVKLNHERIFTFHNNSYYYLVENPGTEEWELHIKEIK